MALTALTSILLAVALAWALPPDGVPRALGTTEQHALVVADLRGHALFVLDPARPQGARRIALPGGPHELAALPDRRVVVSLEQAGSLAIVDVERGIVRELRIGGLPHGLAVTDGTLLVTDREQGAVRRFRLDDWGEEPAMMVGGWPHAVAPLTSGEVVVADAARSTLRMGTSEVRASELPETVAVSPDGSRIATAGAMGDHLELFSSAGDLLLRARTGGRPVRVAFAPSGGQVAVALSAAGAVALVGASGDVRRVVVGGLPDGLLYEGGVLYAGDLSAGRLVAIDPVSARVIDTYALRAGEEARGTGSMLRFPAR